ncbi:sigma-70 family RNA polymerase sigma factor [Acidimangrovimonas sediminis]|uniref:sigma-70 family RNA polymerase sigma factor n=1 Tax=Acidimangrovimonas sediminis TaxID=2056283 RepID=UPI000C7FA664|nr:sigma-70 family RNA polymerase sigma factor [Acidimangrovimonas sediminis]
MTPEMQDGGGELSAPTIWLIAVRDDRDRVAFGRLFDHFAPRLTAMMLRAGLPRAQAEDLVQEVMLTAWQKAGQFDAGRAQASAWIYRIARNRQIDHFRRNRRPLPDAVEMGVEDREDDAQQALALGQETGHLRAALAKLSEEQRAVIEQSFLGDLTHAEIRQRTGLPMGTIKSRIRLGLERLRHELKELR